LAVLMIASTAAIDMAVNQPRYGVVFMGLAITMGGMILRTRDMVVMFGLSLAWVWSFSLWNDPPFGPLDQVLISCFFIALGLVLGTSVALREAIERERLHQLAKSDQRHRGLLEVAFEGLVVLRDDRIVDLNPAFTEICGRSREELMGCEFGEILHHYEPGGDPSLEITGHSSVRQLRLGLREAAGTRPDGEVFHVELVAQSQISDQGPVRYLAVRDISKRRQATLELSMAHRAVALGTLSAGIAHEINNPLTWMMTSLQTASESLRNDDIGHLQGTLDDALAGGRRVISIVRDLKTLSREGSDHGVADVHTALDLACRVASHQIESRARLVRDYGHVPPVVGSSGRLGQVFLNLLTNAAQAIPEGEREHRRILLRTRTCDGEVEVIVRDDGHGIPATILPRIFDPFYTTKGTEGTGLGLSITQSIIDRLGGTIEVDSREGEGATFTLRLPISDRAPSAKPSTRSGQTLISRPEPTAPPLEGRVRVLVIDDEPLMGKSLSSVLREHDVVHTEDPARALELCSETDFDVIVCDLMMPVISGEDVYRHLCEHAPELAARMIFMTGGAFTATAQRFFDEVDNPVLTKPFAPRDLRIAVRRMLDPHAA